MSPRLDFESDEIAVILSLTLEVGVNGNGRGLYIPVGGLVATRSFSSSLTLRNLRRRRQYAMAAPPRQMHTIGTAIAAAVTDLEVQHSKHRIT